MVPEVLPRCHPCRGLTQAAPLPRVCGHGGFSPPPLAGEDLRQRLNRLCWPLEGAPGEWCGVKHRASAALGFRFGFMVQPLTRRHACLTISLLGWHYHQGCEMAVFLKIYLYYFWLRWVFVATCGLSLVAASGGYSSLLCAGFSSWWLLLLQSTGSRLTGFSSCSTRAQ